MGVQSMNLPDVRIAHVLAVGVADAGSGAPEEQRVVHRLMEALQGTPKFQRCQRRGDALFLAFKHDLAVVFFDSPESAACCALELVSPLARIASPKIRLGLHTGPIHCESGGDSPQISGISLAVARQIMECGDAGHILVYNAPAHLLRQFGRWSEMMHPAGEFELANGIQLQVSNLCKGGLGNHSTPERILHPKTEAKDPLIGRSVNHYLVLERLGAGGMGVVYKAKDIRLDRNIAIKFPTRRSSDLRSHLERFQREARSASALNHTNICTIHDVGEWKGWHFIVMELLEGWTLKELMAREPLPIEKVLQYGTEIAQALEAAHGRGIVHRDVKPANIFVNAQGQIKVQDFDLSLGIYKNVRRLHITVDNSAPMCRFQCLCDLSPILQHFLNRQRLARHQLLERPALEKLHHNKVPSLPLANVMDGADIRVIQRGSRASFALEALQMRAEIGRASCREFNRDIAVKTNVFCFVDHSHAARAKPLQHQVMVHAPANERILCLGFGMEKALWGGMVSQAAFA